MNKRRLLKLADFLSALPRVKFDFSTITNQSGKPIREALKAGRHECDTTACAIGWMPAVFPRLTMWENDFYEDTRVAGDIYSPSVCLRDNEYVTDFEVAASVFDIMNEESEYLFSPSSFAGRPNRDATPKRVARHIRRFVARGGMPSWRPWEVSIVVLT